MNRKCHPWIESDLISIDLLFFKYWSSTRIEHQSLASISHACARRSLTILLRTVRDELKSLVVRFQNNIVEDVHVFHGTSMADQTCTNVKTTVDFVWWRHGNTGQLNINQQLAIEFIERSNVSGSKRKFTMFNVTGRLMRITSRCCTSNETRYWACSQLSAIFSLNRRVPYVFSVNQTFNARDDRDSSGPKLKVGGRSPQQPRSGLVKYAWRLAKVARRWVTSWASTHPASYGQWSHLWKSNASESASSIPVTRCRRWGSRMTKLPNAPSTWNQIPSLWAITDNSRRFSKAPVATVPRTKRIELCREESLWLYLRCQRDKARLLTSVHWCSRRYSHRQE